MYVYDSYAWKVVLKSSGVSFSWLEASVMIYNGLYVVTLVDHNRKHFALLRKKWKAM